MWLWLPAEQEPVVQRTGLLWIMGAGRRSRDNLPSIILLHSGQHRSERLCVCVCVTPLHRASRVCWTYGNITWLPVSSKLPPKVHRAISSFNAGLLRDLAALCYLLFAFLIWWPWPVQVEGQQVAAPPLTIGPLQKQMFRFWVLKVTTYTWHIWTTSRKCRTNIYLSVVWATSALSEGQTLSLVVALRQRAVNARIPASPMPLKGWGLYVL